MGWLEGLLTGYSDRLGDIRRENAQEAERSAQREGKVYEALLNSEDPEIRSKAAVGLLSSTQPRRGKGGLAGWMGEMESNPMYPTLMKYMTTPKKVVTETSEPGLPSRQTQGFLPQSTLQVPGQTPSLAQPSTSPTEGEGMAKPKPMPGSLTPPPTPPTFAGLPTQALPEPRSPVGFPQSPEGTTFTQQLEPPDETGSHGGHWVDDQGQHWTLDHDQILKMGQRPLGGGMPALSGPPPPPPGGAGAVSPPGFPQSPEGTTFVQQLQAPTSPSNGGWWVDNKGQQWTMVNDQILKAGQPPITPPPAPPSLSTQPLTPGPPVMRRTETMELPHAFPTQAETMGANEAAKVHGEVRGLQEAFRLQGDPDWQKKGLDAYMAQHLRSTGGVMEGDSQPVYGPLAKQLGVPEGTWMQPLYDKQTGNVVRWIPSMSKTAGRAPNIRDSAAKIMGFNNASEVPTDRAAEHEQKVQELMRGEASNRTGGAAQGRYAEEQKRVNPDNVEMVAANIMHDISVSGPLLSGRSQAFKDAVSNAITAKGGNITKLSEATRQMAETAIDILPVMDTIAKDAQDFDRLGMMGPVAGRWQDFLTGKVGVTELAADPDPVKAAAKVALAGKFRTEVDLLQKAVLRAHAGARGAGSPEGLDRMEGMLNSAKMDLGTFLSSMSGFKVWMDQYAKHLAPAWGTPGQEPETEPQTPQTPSLPPDQATPVIVALQQKYSQPLPQQQPPPPQTPGAFSPQFTTPLRIDPKTGMVAR
jgi:hypothetical protein